MAQTLIGSLRADDIRSLRKSLGWSARRLAEECAKLGEPSLTRSTIAKIESGVRRSVRHSELTVLATALGVEPTRLFDELGQGDAGSVVRVYTRHDEHDIESVSPPAAAGRIPSTSPVFVGRPAELEKLDHVATTFGRTVVVAVHGLGGVGKSTLVARFAQQRADQFSLVWWVTADSPAAVDAGMADLAVAVAPETAGLPLEQRTELGVRWLATHEDWLLVLDNLTAPGDVEGLLARVRTGTIVITSRRSAGWRAMSTLVLDVLAPDEALVLLTGIVRDEWPEADMTDGVRLCEMLGYLPLAVEQAASYIAQTRITPAHYLDLLARYPARMWSETAEGGSAQHTMARVWHITLDRLADTPLAGTVLRRLAWYAPDRIPRSLLEEPDKELELAEALGRLAAYSMITLEAGTISVHRLVQAVTRTPDPDDPHRHPEAIAHARNVTAESLARVLSGPNHNLPADWPIFQAVLPHARALLDHTDHDTDTDTEAHCALANRVGLYVHGQGDTTSAIALFTRASRSLERLRGSDHPDTLTSRSTLAGAYESAGDVDRAIALLEATLADRERVLGSDHPDTLISRINLAHAYRSAGDVGRAIPLLEATLADTERVLGPDHPDTLTSRSTLAGAYESAGDVDRAIALLEATLADRERVLGSDHPDTLTSRSNLARWRGEAGDPAGAVTAFEELLTDMLRVRGPDHPDTLTTRNNLVGWRRAIGEE